MNLFRLSGDLCNVAAVISLMLKICLTRSCAGISGRSQVLFTIAFVCRYLDIFTNFISYYNTILKVFYVVFSLATLCLIYIKFKTTYDSNQDTFRPEILVFPCLLVALISSRYFSFLEILWTFSIYVESVAIVPQLFMMFQTGHSETSICLYVFAKGLYRGLYILNWVYRWHFEHFYDPISVVAGCIQTLLCAGSFVVVLLLNVISFACLYLLYLAVTEMLK